MKLNLKKKLKKIQEHRLLLEQSYSLKSFTNANLHEIKGRQRIWYDWNWIKMYKFVFPLLQVNNINYFLHQHCVFRQRLLRSSWFRFDDACHAAWLGSETSKHGQPKLCPTAPEGPALLSSAEGRFLQCALMFSIYPAHTKRSNHSAIKHANINMSVMMW